jgi:hypothetical protein
MPRASSTRRSSRVSIASAIGRISPGNVALAAEVEGGLIPEVDEVAACPEPKGVEVLPSGCCPAHERDTDAFSPGRRPDAPYDCSCGAFGIDASAYGVMESAVPGDVPAPEGTPAARMFSSDLAAKSSYRAARRRRTSTQASTAARIAPAGIPSPSPRASGRVEDREFEVVAALAVGEGNPPLAVHQPPEDAGNKQQGAIPGWRAGRGRVRRRWRPDRRCERTSRGDLAAHVELRRGRPDPVGAVNVPAVVRRALEDRIDLRELNDRFFARQLGFHTPAR